MSMDFDALRTLPGTTHEEFERIQAGILALASSETEPVTIESLWKFYTEAKVIPMVFKPTGEVIDVTLQFRDWIERHSQQPGQAAQGGKQ